MRLRHMDGGLVHHRSHRHSSEKPVCWNPRSADRTVVAIATAPVYVMIGAGTRGSTDTIADDAQNSFRIGYKAITHNMSF